MSATNKRIVVVAMSGGVDSSVAAYLLHKSSYEVIGVFMRLGLGPKEEENERAVRRVCSHLGIKFYPVNISQDFKAQVIDYFIESYANGFTPNPCVRCNQFIKFGDLFNIAEKIGADFIATGHYIIKKTETIDGQTVHRIFRGRDSNKDQSYFLHNLNQKILAKAIFPVGDYQKDETKQIAKEAKLPCLSGESQDICFLTGDHNDFLRRHISSRPGNIKTLDGKIIGQHQGLPFYTIGQRKGVEIGGSGPYYVVKTDYRQNILIVTDKPDDAAMFNNGLIFSYPNFINPKLTLPLRCQASVRYRQTPVNCLIEESPIMTCKNRNKTFLAKFNEGKEQDMHLVRFDAPQRAVTVGQSVVFYQGDELLGGGLICSSL